MSLGRATMRRDGWPRITVAINHEVTSDDLVAAMCMKLWRSDEPEATASKAAIERALRDVLRDRGGDGLTYWSDEWDDGDADTARDWATAIVRKHWPELFKTARWTSASATKSSGPLR